MRTARPTPRPGFVGELERSLARRTARRARPRMQVALAGTGLAAVLAALIVALAVTGLLPLSSGGSAAKAEQDCQNVTVKRVEQQPYFVLDAKGRVHVRYRNERVARVVKRCR
jgi:hypothetical protein